DALMRLRRRSWPALMAGLLFGGMSAATIVLVLALRPRLIADPVRWKELIDSYYLSTRREHEWLNGPLAYQQLTDGLDRAHPQPPGQRPLQRRGVQPDRHRQFRGPAREHGPGPRPLDPERRRPDRAGHARRRGHAGRDGRQSPAAAAPSRRRDGRERHRPPR